VADAGAVVGDDAARHARSFAWCRLVDTGRTRAGWIRTLGGRSCRWSSCSACGLSRRVAGARVLAWGVPPLRTLSDEASVSSRGRRAVMIVLLLTPGTPIDSATHELFYRQTSHALKRSAGYIRRATGDGGLPMKPGAAVAVADPAQRWLLGGVIQEFNGPDLVRVAFTDESIRVVRPRRGAHPIGAHPRCSLSRGLCEPGELSHGTSLTAKAAARYGSALPRVGCPLRPRHSGGGARRLSHASGCFHCASWAVRLALIAGPGAPGNGDRHSATQTLPLLLVFAAAAGLTRVARASSGRAVRSMSTSPSTRTPAASRMRSAR